MSSPTTALAIPQTKPRRKRAANPKARTGCVTCKKRRVKCDETKPFCTRCVKLGIQCGGYRFKGSGYDTSATNLKPRLIPKPASQLNYTPTTLMFTNDQEKYCYLVFCDKTARKLSGCFDSTLWDRIVLQACETNPAVRHAVVAIGALDFTLGISHGPPLLSSSERLQSNQEEAEKHHRFALKQFGAAIKEMRILTAKEQPDIRRTLLGCLVMACFESLHGNFPSAIAQVQGGLSLLEDWQLRTKSNLNHQDLLGASSPLPYTIEDELHQALCRLDIQLLSFTDFRPAILHGRMRTYGTTSLASMPSKFSTLKEARIYLEIIMRRIMHFRAYLSPPLNDQTGMLRITPQPNSPTDSALTEQNVLIDELARWYKAYAPLYQRTSSPTTTFTREEINIALTLRIHYLITKFAINMSPINPTAAQTFASKSAPLCREIVSLSQTFLKNEASISESNGHATQGIPKFSFDFGIITSLYIMGMRCPNIEIRKLAISLLRKYPRREGIWDGLLAARVLEWVGGFQSEDCGAGEERAFYPFNPKLNEAMARSGARNAAEAVLRRQKKEAGRKENGVEVEEYDVPLSTGVVDMSYDFDLQVHAVRIRCKQLKQGVEGAVDREIKLSWL